MPVNEQLIQRLLNVYGNDTQSIRHALSGLKANTFRKAGKMQRVDAEFDSESGSYILPEVNIEAKPMSEFRKNWRKAMNMPIMVPATAPGATATATWQYNPNNLMQTTPKQELDYLAGLAVPVAPYITSGYFLGTGIGDMEENGVGVGNTIQVGLSTLPFVKPIGNAAGKFIRLGVDKFTPQVQKINASAVPGKEFAKSDMTFDKSLFERFIKNTGSSNDVKPSNQLPVNNKSDILESFEIDPDKRFAWFRPQDLIDYDLSDMTIEEVGQVFGPEAERYKKFYDLASKVGDETRKQHLKERIFDMFALNREDPDIVIGRENATRMYSIPDYVQRFNKFGTLGDTFIDDALHRIDNAKLQGRTAPIRINDIEAMGYTLQDPTSPTIGIGQKFSNSKRLIQQISQHEYNHASHGSHYQPEWMKNYNEKLRPIRKEGVPESSYYEDMDEIIARSKTAVEFADRMRKPGETLESSLERLSKVNSSEIEIKDIRDLLDHFDKESLLNFWKNFVGSYAAPTLLVPLGASAIADDNTYKSGGKKEPSDRISRIAKFYHDNADKMPKWLHRAVYNTIKDASFSENPISEIKYDLLPNLIHNRSGAYDNMFLMSPAQQEQALRSAGFEPVDTAGNYGLVHSAVQRYKNATGRDVPIYQKGVDQIEREHLTPLNNNILSGYSPVLKVISDKQESINEPSDLGDIGSAPYRLYRGDDGKLYYRMWDFFDHGDYSRDSYANNDDEYVTKSLTDNSQKYGNLLDMMGNPFVKTTGFTEVPNYAEALRHLPGAGFVLESEVPEYMDRVNAGEFDYKNGGKIHIKPENRGKFTSLLKRTGKSASWFKAHGTPAQKRMATFALASRHWRHDNGGLLHTLNEEYQIGQIYDLSEEQVNELIRQGYEVERV